MDFWGTITDHKGEDQMMIRMFLKDHSETR